MTTDADGGGFEKLLRRIMSSFDILSRASVALESKGKTLFNYV